MKISGPAVLQVLSGDDDLRDSALTRFEISGRSDVVVTMEFDCKNSSKFAKATLRFEDVIECDFYHRWDRIFFYVSHRKFLATSDGAFYLSIDPYDEAVCEPAEEDGCFVKARVVTVELTPR